MLKTGIGITILLCVAFLAQSSFFAHFPIYGVTPNLVLLLVLGIALFSDERHPTDVVAALVGGIILDIFSSSFFGIWIGVLLALVLGIRFFVRKYVRLSTFSIFS